MGSRERLGNHEEFAPRPTPARAVLAALSAAIAVVAVVMSVGPARGASVPIQTENAKAGTGNWEPLITRTPLDQTHAIEGYSSQVSVLPGGTVQLHVSTAPAARYRVEVYRLGWYGGAGGRLIGCVPSCTGDKQGAAQPIPAPDPTTGMVRASWPVTDSFVVPSDAVSGYYSFKLLLTTGPRAGQSYNVFVIVKAPPGQNAAILVQASVNTWQAYNGWGGKSLYPNSSTNGVEADIVSFDRPYDTTFYPVYEINLLRWLEKEGYDVSYTTDVDTERDPAELTRHKLVISSGHDEYWSKTMRDAFEAARAAGTNLAFVGADISDWQIRYEDGERTIVEYRDAVQDPIADPALKTVRFSELVPPRPQCELLGIQYQNGIEVANHPLLDYTVTSDALTDPLFQGTGFAPGDRFLGSVGYEFDAVVPGCNVPTPTVLFHYEGQPVESNADAVIYTAPSGAKVFSTGSLNFVAGLDPYPGPPDTGDPRVQQFMRNVLADLTNAPPVSTAPTNSAPPVVGGSAVAGQTLNVVSNGTWSGKPTSYSTTWLRCNVVGDGCTPIGIASGSSYTVQLSDIGSTIRAQVTATNGAGATSAPSDPTGAVQAAGTSFGTSVVQAAKCVPGPDVVDANGPYTVSGPLTVTEALGYLQGGGFVGQRFRVAVYADAGGTPGTLLGTSSELNVAPAQTASWIRFPFPNPILLPAGSYWLGYWYGPNGNGGRVSCTNGVAGFERFIGAPYSATGSAPNPWSGGNVGDSRYALFAGSGDTAPTNVARPGISGVAAAGQAVTASHGIWTNGPTGFSYQWRRCDSTGASCASIGGATAQTYVLTAADVGKTVVVLVTARNNAGTATTASAPSPVVAASASGSTLGRTGVGASTVTGGHGFVATSGPYTLSSPQTVTKLSGFVQGAETADPLRAVIYADGGTGPGAFVAVSNEVVIPAGADASWVDFTFPNALTLPAGKYWLGYWFGGNTQTYYDDTPAAGMFVPLDYSGTGDPPPVGEPWRPSTVALSLYAQLVPPTLPDNTTPPTISGTTMQGRTLTATTGTWRGNPTAFSYQWRRCDALVGLLCTDIDGATASTYVLQAADINRRVRVVVTGSNIGGSDSATSAATGVVQAAVDAPDNRSAPSISGTAKQGRTLTASTGSWSGNPTAFAYQWRRCDPLLAVLCADIDGATSSSYVVQAADIGLRLRVVVVATNAGGSTGATSGSTPVVVAAMNAPSPTAPPTISGTAKQGQTLTATTGSWNGSPTSFAYQWRRCDALVGLLCSDIDGATSQSYVLGADDVGQRLRVVVTATNAGGSNDATSSATSVVQQSVNAPGNATPPGISGTAKQGQTLTATTGSWNGNPTSFTYQWRRCDSAGATCADIAGATAQTYVLQAADIGTTLRVVVTGTNAGGSASATSAQTSLVQPNITGSTLGKTTIGAQQATVGGSGLLIVSGAYTLSAPASVTKLTGYVQGTSSQQPLRAVIYADDGSNEPGALVAASSEVTLAANAPAALVDFTFAQQPILPAGKYWLGYWSGGNVLVFFDTATGAGNVSSAAYSSTGNPPATFGAGTDSTLSLSLFATLGPVVTAPTNTAPPTISGTATQGQTLTAANGSWNGNPTSFTYQWRRCDATGAACADIAGATSQTYALQSEDVGRTLRVVVTATNGGGSTPATSAQTAVVQVPPPAAPTSMSAPTISGSTRRGQTLTASTGSWSGSPTSFAYQWLRCSSSGSSCSEISGANDRTYVLQSSDVSRTLRVMVTATNAGGSTPATSAATSVVSY